VTREGAETLSSRQSNTAALIYLAVVDQRPQMFGVGCLILPRGGGDFPQIDYYFAFTVNGYTREGVGGCVGVQLSHLALTSTGGNLKLGLAGPPLEDVLVGGELEEVDLDVEAQQVCEAQPDDQGHRTRDKLHYPVPCSSTPNPSLWAAHCEEPDAIPQFTILKYSDS